MTPEYAAFLASKAPRAFAAGEDRIGTNPLLFDYQTACATFCIKQGRAGLFLDTGLGKTAVALDFAAHAGEFSNGRVLILTPLAVAQQYAAEARKFGYGAHIIREQRDARGGINICNYDRLDKIDPAYFGAVVLDESSILKSFTGKTTRALIEAFKGHRWRLACTATPAPNDHMELGQHAEFLGVMPAMEMLMRWFINDASTASQEWRLKRHGVDQFWDWMAGWARMAQTPDDLGFDGSRFKLPPLNIVRHQTFGDVRAPAGSLFVEDVSATNLHDLKRQTAGARADAVAALASDGTDPWVVWCDTDYEADALLKRMPMAGEVRGSHAIERKEETLAAFASGELRVLITKPSICGYGLNWQHCANMAFVGRSFSYESWYQAVRRCWRFGQKRAVNAHVIVAEGEDQIGRVIDRKSEDHARMKAAMAAAMKRAAQDAQIKVPYVPTHKGSVPAWLTA